VGGVDEQRQHTRDRLATLAHHHAVVLRALEAAVDLPGLQKGQCGLISFVSHASFVCSLWAAGITTQ
jgi:hypothetical protein